MRESVIYKSLMMKSSQTQHTQGRDYPSMFHHDVQRALLREQVLVEKLRDMAKRYLQNNYISYYRGYRLSSKEESFPVIAGKI